MKNKINKLTYEIKISHTHSYEISEKLDPEHNFDILYRFTWIIFKKKRTINFYLKYYLKDLNLACLIIIFEILI